MVQTLQEKIVLIRASITQLKQVACVYKGHDRLLCFHILGTKNGVWKCYAWQFAGGSSRPHELPMWRDMFLTDVIGITSRDGDWHRGWTTGQRDQRAVDAIDTVVDADHAAEIRNISYPHIQEHRFRR